MQQPWPRALWAGVMVMNGSSRSSARMGHGHRAARGPTFLIRGRAPVVMSKLQYAGNWNERPRDLANLVQWMSKQTERHLNWQIVNLQAPVHELHDAPILCVPCVPEEGSERRRTLANGPRNARRRSVVRDAPSAPSGDADSFGVR